MTFSNPEYLLLLLIIPLLIGYYFFQSQKKRGTIRFSSLTILRHIGPSPWQKTRHSLLVLRLLALILIITGLARPQFGRTYEDILTQGIDIILAVDLSASMYAEDLKPNRLEVARKVVEEFIKGRLNDRIGLVVFAGIAYSLCPPTLDYNVLQEFLDKLEIGMAEDGTAIGMGIVSSVNRLKDSKAKSKIIILLTDGENNLGEVDPITAAKIAQALGIKIYTIGVGQEGGAPIPIDSGFWGRRYARNADGSILLTHLDEECLKKIADITGGRYFRAIDEEKLRNIYKIIGEMEKTDFKSRHYTKYRELFMNPVLIAFFLILFEIFLANTRFMRIP
ncbi:MAG: von Willebrand factor type A domain protein [bacterium ADurb.Bin363]|nr:MAG: von Willebrand factor type A domain protein [bacterium ADurb.Bin363]